MLSEISQKQILVFDLDGTLIDETTYLFDRLHFFLCTKITDKILIEDILQKSRVKVLSEGASGLLDWINQQFMLELGINQFRDFLRTDRLRTNICILSGVKEKLTYLESLYTLWICTNGNYLQQKNKIDRLFDELGFSMKVIYCDKLTSKPDPAGLFEILKIERCHGSVCLFVGNSNVDIEAAQSADIDYVDARIFFDQISCE